MSSSHPQLHTDAVNNLSSRVHAQNVPPHGWIPVENVLLANQAIFPHHQHQPHDQQQSLDSGAVRDKLSGQLKRKTASPVVVGEVGVHSKQSSVKSKKMKRSDSDTECREEKSERSHDRHHKPDILTTVLNQKKLSLMQDPEVLAFFKKFVRNKPR